MLKTKLSIRQIQLALRDSWLFNRRDDIIVPNVSWGLIGYEADLLAINKTGQVTEVEIKRSMEDLLADFKKKHRHNSATYFYYCVPESIADRAKEAIMEHEKTFCFTVEPDYCPALLCYTERLTIKDTGFGKAKRFGYQPVGLEEKAILGRLASLRYWNLLAETVQPEDFGSQRKIRDLRTDLKMITRQSELCEEEHNKLIRFLRSQYPEILKEYYMLLEKSVDLAIH